MKILAWRSDGWKIIPKLFINSSWVLSIKNNALGFIKKILLKKPPPDDIALSILKVSISRYRTASNLSFRIVAFIRFKLKPENLPYFFENFPINLHKIMHSQSNSEKCYEKLRKMLNSKLLWKMQAVKNCKRFSQNCNRFLCYFSAFSRFNVRFQPYVNAICDMHFYNVNCLVLRGNCWYLMSKLYLGHLDYGFN